MDKENQHEPAFECTDLNLATNNSCYFESNKPADCLYEEQNKHIENNDEANAEDCDINSADCNLYNMRKRCKEPLIFLDFL